MTNDTRDTEETEDDVEVIIIEENNANTRLDKVLSDHFQENSRTYFQYLFEKKCVLVNQKPVKKQFKAKMGDVVTVVFLLPQQTDLKPENIPLDILYEDNDIIVINKPKGMVVHPAPGNWSSTLVNGLLYHVQGILDTFQKEEKRPGIVHRLDKDTTGVILAAKHLLAHQRLIKAFSSRKVFKEYLGICIGNPGRGLISKPIGRDPKNRKQMTALKGGKEAITEFETMESDGVLSLVRFVIKTGRTHQIRVHMKDRGTPLLGDLIYGDLKQNKRFKIEGQLLHASKLTLMHPMTEKLVTFIAPIPDGMETLIQKIKQRKQKPSS